MIAPYVRREAVASSRIEGTQADLSDLLLDELTPERTSPAGDVLEVRNYVAALRLGMDKLKPLPFAGRLVCDLHRVLMRDVRGEYAAPGEYRRTQNWIGPAGTTLMTAKYVPPPVDEMHECLKQWELFVNTRGRMPELVQCALMHEYFEAIHPFIDGNGRVGRLLIPLFLIERRRLSKPLLYLSAFIERHRGDYYDLLNAVRTRGEWLPWVRYFLAGRDRQRPRRHPAGRCRAAAAGNASRETRRQTPRPRPARRTVRQPVHHHPPRRRAAEGVRHDG